MSRFAWRERTMSPTAPFRGPMVRETSQNWERFPDGSSSSGFGPNVRFRDNAFASISSRSVPQKSFPMEALQKWDQKCEPGLVSLTH